MKSLHLFAAAVALFFCAQNTSAQSRSITRSSDKTDVSADQHRECAAHEKFVEMMGLNPAFHARQEQMETQTALFVESLQASRASNANISQDVVTIPVVFHIVYANDEENIPDSEIFEQMQILNDDFRRLNENQDDLWPQAADAEIEFCLAVRDPNSAPTSGILRVETSVGSFGTNDNVKFSDLGGSDAWPANDYLNIWVCNLGGWLGYAQFPGGNPATDGIVCAYANVGIDGPGSGIYNLGRTATHEIGHWLNLRHIWGDGGCGVDDFVDDTPESDGANFNCDIGHESCGSVDMVQNYMDYSSDLCMSAFTQGQSDRMAATLAPGGVRYSLRNSLGCVPPTPDFDLDVAVMDVVEPQGFSCATDVTPEVNILNFGGDTLTSLELAYSLDGVPQGTFTWTGNLAYGALETVTLPTLTPDDGNHTIEVVCNAPNGGMDENPGNDAASSDFTLDSQGTELALVINLDNWPGETTWDLADVDGNVVWTGGPYSNAYSQVTEVACVPTACYTFTIYDVFEDGICCEFGLGDYALMITTSGDTLASGGAFDEADPMGFCLAEGVTGCMDEAACNYEENAVVDDMTCDYSCIGCTHELACNYDPEATEDDGSCVFPEDGVDCVCVTMTLDFDFFSEDQSWEIIDGAGEVVWSGGPYEGGLDDFTETICMEDGCYQLTVYDAYGDGMCCWWSSGSYELSSGGVILASGAQFQSEETTVFCLGDGPYGCTDPGACNFESEDLVEDFSCDYSCTGCMDDVACNYDPEATIDDGGCEYAPPGELCACLDLLIITDNYPQETTWALTDADGGVLWSGGPYYTQGDTLIEAYCPGEGCYNFTIYDSYGDGVCCGYGEGDFMLVLNNTDTLAHGGDFGEAASIVFCVGDGTMGCTDSGACNYDPDATINNGNCDYSCLGCTDPLACNYDPDATEDDGSCEYPDPDANCNCVSMSLMTDNYPNEISWNITDFAGNVVWSGDNYTQGNTEFVVTNCLVNGCYTFNIYDSWGDGICCSEGDGFYELVGGGLILADGGDYGYGETIEFCIGDDIPGCTDEAACNYNPFATEDDGSCYYPDDAIVDCDGNCYNDADGDGVCDENEIAGCTDPDAVNYNPDATDDDGSCTDEEPGSFTELTYELVEYNSVGTMDTYRVYANFTDPGDQLVAVFGHDEANLSITSETGFYQDALGGPTPALINPELFDAFPDLAYDTWITVGGEDNSAAINQIGIDFSDFEAGNSLIINDFTGGSVFIYPGLEPTAFPDAEGRVLIGQFTTDGEVDLLINLQYRTAAGSNPQVTGLALNFPDTPPCPGDWNNDGLISISDMLMVLSEFGCAEGCNYDMSGDGSVTTTDILQMLSLFGSTCPE